MILIYSEDKNRVAELITAAQTLKEEATVLTAVDDLQAQQWVRAGVRVAQVKEDLPVYDTAAMAEAIAQAAIAAGADTVFLASNRRGKELAGRLAQKIGAGCLTDARSLSVSEGKLLAVRNALGGATETTQEITSTQKVVAVSPKAYQPAPAGDGGSVETIAVAASPAKVIRKETRKREKDNVDIEAAEVILAVGQGAAGVATLTLADEVAAKFGGVLACSKPIATDRKWLSEERVIGLSGKHCAPQLIFVMGISGQVQFTVGMRDAGTVVTVNNDENAPMCQMSDYVLVADLDEALRDLKNAVA